MTDQAVNVLPPSVDADTQDFRSHVGHISRHSGVFFAGTIFSVALGYLFKVYLARALGAESLGIYALGMTLVGFAGTFNSLGLMESAVRFASVYRSTQRFDQLRALLWRGGGILLMANAFFAIIFWNAGRLAALRFYHSAELARYIPWFTLIMLLGVISTFYGRVLAGYKQVGRRTVIINFIGSPAAMLFALILISLGWGLRGYLAAQVSASVLMIILLIGFVWKLTPPESRLNLHSLPKLDPEVWSFSAAAMGVLLLEFLMIQVDKVALGFFRGAREVGIYSVAAAMVSYVSLFLSSVNQVFSSVIADLHARGENIMLGRLYKSLTKWILALTLPLAITVMVYASPLLRIFGHDFEAGWPILIIGTAGQLINCGVGSVGLLLLMSGNQNRLLRVQAGMAMVMTLASVALVPVWGILGAAVAAAITNAGQNAWNLLEVRKHLGFSPFSRSYLRLLVPATLSVVVALLLKSRMDLFGRYWVGTGIALLATYIAFAGTVALMGLDSDDRLVTDALLSRIRGRIRP